MYVIQDVKGDFVQKMFDDRDDAFETAAALLRVSTNEHDTVEVFELQDEPSYQLTKRASVIVRDDVGNLVDALD